MTKDEFLKKYYSGVNKDIKKDSNKAIKPQVKRKKVKKDKAASIFKSREEERKAKETLEKAGKRGELYLEYDDNNDIGIIPANQKLEKKNIYASERKFRVGDRVLVKYRGQEGIVIDINQTTYMVSINDGGYVDSYSEDQLQKVW